MSPAALLALSALLCVVFPAGSVIFRLDPNGQQCISEDAGSEQVLVYVQYNVTSRPDDAVKVALEVTSTEDQAKGKKEEVMVEEKDITDGKVTFISDASEEFRICFRSTSPNKGFDGMVEIMVDVRTGIDAKDYSTVAKQEHLGVLELELKKLEDEVKQIMEEMVYMRIREEAMRNTNESTNARVLWFSVFSMYHLKQYFKKKKLI